MVRSILLCWNLFRLDKILPCFLERIYLNQILPGTLEELGVNLGKIIANRNLARLSWLFIQDTCKILGNIFSRAKLSRVCFMDLIVILRSSRVMNKPMDGWFTRYFRQFSATILCCMHYSHRQANSRIIYSENLRN